MRKPTRRALFLGIVAGILSGLFFAQTTSYLDFGTSYIGSGHVIELLPGEVDWTNWTILVPGALFGLAFALAKIGASPRTLLYTLASTGIYAVAVHLFAWTLNSAPAIDRSLRLYTGGLIAGLFGALMLAVTLQRFAPISPRDLARTAVVGALAGVVFVWLMNEPWLCAEADGEGAGICPRFTYVFWPIAFALWQGAVGWSLAGALSQNPLLRSAAAPAP